MHSQTTIALPRSLHICFDFHGCPNNCRHCWLGTRTRCRFSQTDAEALLAEIRAWRMPGEQTPHFERMSVHSWFREPDFGARYRDLWEWEQRESSPGAAERFELMSTWRLARDPSYLPFLKEQGTEACQITFHGGAELTDWFTRRSGTYRDNLVAAQVLLAAGIAPRFQYFLTKPSLACLREFESLVRGWLEPRCQAAGLPCVAFVNSAGPEGNAWELEPLRIEAKDLAQIPAYLAQKTCEHLGVEEIEEALGKSEEDWLHDLRAFDAPSATAPSALILNVNGEGEIFWGGGQMTPHWRLCHLGTENFSRAMERLSHCETKPLAIRFAMPVSRLAKRHRREGHTQLYAREEIISRWEKLELMDH